MAKMTALAAGHLVACSGRAIGAAEQTHFMQVDTLSTPSTNNEQKYLLPVAEKPHGYPR